MADQNGNGLSGASVTLVFKQPNGSTQCSVSATSGSNGIAQAPCATQRNTAKGIGNAHLGGFSTNLMSTNLTGSVVDSAFTVQ